MCKKQFKNFIFVIGLCNAIAWCDADSAPEGARSEKIDEQVLGRLLNTKVRLAEENKKLAHYVRVIGVILELNSKIHGLQEEINTHRGNIDALTISNEKAVQHNNGLKRAYERDVYEKMWHLEISLEDARLQLSDYLEKIGNEKTLLSQTKTYIDDRLDSFLQKNVETRLKNKKLVLEQELASVRHEFKQARQQYIILTQRLSDTQVQYDMLQEQVGQLSHRAAIERPIVSDKAKNIYEKARMYYSDVQHNERKNDFFLVLTSATLAEQQEALVWSLQIHDHATHKQLHAEIVHSNRSFAEKYLLFFFK